MSELSITPDLSAFEIPMDQWTQPFWDAAEQAQLLAPRCSACQHFRWPPGPFCPHCQSQSTEWVPAGRALVYSFTIIPEPGKSADEPARCRVPALIEFPDADGIRIVAAIVDTPAAAIHIGAPVRLGWSQAANAKVPVFSIAAKDAD